MFLLLCNKIIVILSFFGDSQHLGSGFPAITFLRVQPAGGSCEQLGRWPSNSGHPPRHNWTCSDKDEFMTRCAQLSLEKAEILRACVQILSKYANKWLHVCVLCVFISRVVYLWVNWTPVNAWKMWLDFGIIGHFFVFAQPQWRFGKMAEVPARHEPTIPLVLGSNMDLIC